MKKISSILFFATALLLFSCGSKPSEKIKGKWKHVSTYVMPDKETRKETETMHYFFNDTSYLYQRTDIEGPKENWAEKSYPYHLDEEENMLLITLPNSEIVAEKFKYDFTGNDELKLTYDMLGRTYTYTLERQK